MDEPKAVALSREWFGLAGEELAEADAASLTVSRPARIDLARVPEAFGAGAATWLGAPDGPDQRGLMRYLCDLELHTGTAGRHLFRKAAIVSLGQPAGQPGGWLVPIEWRAATLAPLFPVLVGSLAIEPERITLRGTYAPPLGVIGQALDRALLSIAARGTARWFLARAAAAVAG